jgi:1-acyl-sn-glycerol-3-phosphate acyltransferase
MRRERRRWRLGWGYRLAVFVLWPFMQGMTKRDWRGTEHLNADDGGIIVAGNHMSWFDPLVIAHILWENDRPPRFLAKESVFRVPFVGSVIRSAGQVPVYRESAIAVEALRDAVAAVERGECVVIYPEGTLTRDPALWPMRGKTGAARVALATGRPLIPLAQWGAQEVLAPYTNRLRLLPRKTMQVRIGPPVDLSDLAGAPLDADTLRVATDRLMDAITALLAEIRHEEPPKERTVFDRRSR